MAKKQRLDPNAKTRKCDICGRRKMADEVLCLGQCKLHLDDERIYHICMDCEVKIC